jgi:hypothetical protein
MAEIVSSKASWTLAFAVAVLPPILGQLSSAPSANTTTPLTQTPGKSQTPVANQLSWVDAGKLSFEPPTDLEKAHGQRATPAVYLYIKNESTTVATVLPEMSLKTQKGALVKASFSTDTTDATTATDSVIVPSGISAIPARIILPAFRGGANGLLWFAAKSSQGTILLAPRQVTIAGQNSGAVNLFWIAALVAPLCVALAYNRMKKRPGLKDPVGSPKWDFTKSWANNVTVAASVISTTVLLALLVQEPVFLSKANYLALNALLVVLLAVAPAIFALRRRQTNSVPGQDPEYSGTVSGFLLACGVTLSAVLGQLCIAVLLLEEMRWQDVLWSPTGFLFDGIVLATAAALIVYSFKAIPATLLAMANPPPPKPPKLTHKTHTSREFGFDRRGEVERVLERESRMDVDVFRGESGRHAEGELKEEAELEDQPPETTARKPRDWALL